MKYVTWVNVEKVKDMDTGGKHTALNDPIMFDFNSGLGFTVNGVDPLKSVRPKPQVLVQTRIETNEILTTSEKLRRLAEDTPF
jgi:hypothetical protein